MLISYNAEDDDMLNMLISGVSGVWPGVGKVGSPSPIPPPPPPPLYASDVNDDTEDIDQGCRFSDFCRNSNFLLFFSFSPIFFSPPVHVLYV